MSGNDWGKQPNRDQIIPYTLQKNGSSLRDKISVKITVGCFPNCFCVRWLYIAWVVRPAFF